jgi:hypothetical protein
MSRVKCSAGSDLPRLGGTARGRHAQSTAMGVENRLVTQPRPSQSLRACHATRSSFILDKKRSSAEFVGEWKTYWWLEGRVF